MRDGLDHFRAAGLHIVTIGMGSPEVTRTFHIDMALPFPLLADPERLAYRAYGLLKTNMRKERPIYGTVSTVRNLLKHGGGLPANQDVQQLGGVFVIDQHAVIHYANRLERAYDTVPNAEVIAAWLEASTP